MLAAVVAGVGLAFAGCRGPWRCLRSGLVAGNAVSAVALAALALWQLALAWMVAPGSFAALPADVVLFLLVASPAVALSLSVALCCWRVLGLVAWLGRAAAAPHQRSVAGELTSSQRASVSATSVIEISSGSALSSVGPILRSNGSVTIGTV